MKNVFNSSSHAHVNLNSSPEALHPKVEHKDGDGEQDPKPLCPVKVKKIVSTMSSKKKSRASSENMLCRENQMCNQMCIVETIKHLLKNSCWSIWN
jgi:hypothetical protein